MTKTLLSTNVRLAAVVNLAQKEGHSAAHVYLTTMHYDAISHHMALNTAAYTASTRQRPGCIIQRVTRLLITEKRIFTE